MSDRAPQDLALVHLSSLVTGYLLACTLSNKSSPQCQASPNVLVPFYFLSPFCNNLFYLIFFFTYYLFEIIFHFISNYNLSPNL